MAESHEAQAWRRGLIPALLAVALAWAVGWRNVSTLNYPHAVWRCGSTWNIEVNHATPVPTHLDVRDTLNGGTVTIDPQTSAATQDCIAAARNDLDWQVPAAIILAVWLLVWHRQWIRAKDRDFDESRRPVKASD